MGGACGSRHHADVCSAACHSPHITSPAMHCVCQHPESTTNPCTGAACRPTHRVSQHLDAVVLQRLDAANQLRFAAILGVEIVQVARQVALRHTQAHHRAVSIAEQAEQGAGA